MMKKVALIAAAAAMVLPLGLGTIAPATAGVTAFAATKTAAKKTTYTLVSRQSLKKAAYHVKSGKPVLYSASFAADKAKVSMAKKGNLKTKTTYYATKKIVVKTKATKTAKAKTLTCCYVTSANGKVKGWVAASVMTAGKYKAATKKTYTLVSTKALKKSPYHFTGTKPACYVGKFAADKAKVTLTKGGTLATNKTYYATKKMTVKQNKKDVSYCYVSGHGWVLASKFVAGKYMPAK